MAEHGTIIISDPGADAPVLEAATLQCVHCGAHFPAKPMRPSGRFFTHEEAAAMSRGGETMRGYCMACAGPICGPGCDRCVPTEQLLINMEKGLPLDHRPIVIPVPRRPD